jgi:hypothetical protein
MALFASGIPLAGRRLVRLWALPTAVSGDARLVRDWVESVTGLFLDANEAVMVLDAREWHERGRK